MFHIKGLLAKKKSKKTLHRVILCALCSITHPVTDQIIRPIIAIIQRLEILFTPPLPPVEITSQFGYHSLLNSNVKKN